MEISVKKVGDSIRKSTRERITSIECVIPRIILAELNTHRMLSRNSASSRAIPTQKMLQTVKLYPFVPIKWMKDHSGMQGTEYWSDELLDKLEWQIGSKKSTVAEVATHTWLKAKDMAMDQVAFLSKIGITKQMSNRLLEPFMWHRVLVTATEWENFLALRAEEHTEIHFQDFAYKVLELLNDSTPQELQPGEWHIPYGDEIDKDKLHSVVCYDKPVLWEEPFITKWKVKIATARCNRTSYTTPDTEEKHNYKKDLELHDRMASVGHFSGFEHCNMCMQDLLYENSVRTEIVGFDERGPLISMQNGWCGNVRGFIQYRKFFSNENRTDSRLIRK